MAPLPFHQATQDWFRRRFGEPTDIQAQAWPELATGGHVLVCAPTGTGKTLTAFLGALDRLLTGQWEAGSLRVLYVSPLKALNSDIRRNLQQPLEELQARFSELGTTTPPIRVMVRSGDTPEDERRQLRRNPPEILITTPESLGILLTQKRSTELFAGLKVVILDEIHAVIGSKRGTSLLVSLERLVEYAGEFQRVGLSATVNPPGLVAQALAGLEAPGQPRPVAVIASTTAKAYEVQVVLPEFQRDDDTGKVYWQSLALELRRRTQDRNSTLIFSNSRRACEKLARLMNENALSPESTELLAYSHHGSLSKEIRRDVELQLKAGELKALVATNSLELGIDIGDLDEIILAETPRTAASAIQKVGRAGHAIGEVSRARLYPSHGIDLVEAAVIVRCIREQTVEPVVVPEGPLDVLAQLMLSAWSARPTTADSLFSVFRRSWPYRNLNRSLFDLVVDMLAGRFAGTRIRELKPRVIPDPATGLWSTTAAVPFLLYRSGGTIPDRGYFSLRDHRTGSAIGELDEEFVWERTLGDRFALGAQVWKIAAIDDQSVRVEPVQAPPHIIPFWKAEDQDRSWFLAEKVALFLCEAEKLLEADGEGLHEQLVQNDGFSPEAAKRLVETLRRERKVVGALPHRWRMVIEQVVPDKHEDREEMDADQYVLHTFWGARINRPWAFAMAQAWEDRHGYALETYPGDDQILILVPPDTGIEEVLSLVTSTNLEDLLRRRLVTTGYFGARFREGAGRALLLPKAGFSKRTPLWQTRLRAKRLFGAVSGFSEFPILLEAWRQCLKDEFELEPLRQLLDERAQGTIETWQAKTSVPSPFTEGLLWRQVNEKMYANDDPPARSAPALDGKLWNELLAPERPRIPRDVAIDWESRWGRTAAGYAPETPAELADLLELRIALTPAEWESLVDACARDWGDRIDFWKTSVPITQQGQRIGLATVAERWHEPESLWLRWLEGRAPVSIVSMATFWDVDQERLLSWINTQQSAGTIVFGPLSEGSESEEVCLAAEWEQIVRRMRGQRRVAAPMRPVAGLPLFLAARQGLLHPGRSGGNLENVLSPLLGLPLNADLWEAAVLPSRIQPYRPVDFDRLFIEGGLRWFGAGPERVVLGFPENWRDFCELAANGGEAEARILEALAPGTEVSFVELSNRTALPLASLTRSLWTLTWSGSISATTFGPLRQGLRTNFEFDRGEAQGRVGGRAGGGFQRWSSARTSGGTWTRWASPTSGTEVSAGEVANLEQLKNRVRLVLDRYGIIFRALLVHEAPRFQWKALFPALRLMELSGEIVGGVFWEGVPGLQFATAPALRDREASDEEATLWIQHAQDPSSLCGLGIEALSSLPRRTSGTWLWWRGSQLIAVLSANGKRLELRGEGWEPLICRMATILLVEGRTSWGLETINDAVAADSSAREALLLAGFRAHGDKLILWKA